MNDNLIATATVQINASPEDVWQAITDPELIEKYYFGTRAESDWRPGSTITWSGEYEGKEYRDHGTILEAVPRERLVHTHFSPLTGREDVPGQPLIMLDEAVDLFCVHQAAALFMAFLV